MDENLSERIAAAAREMQQQSGSTDTLGTVINIALQLVPHAQEAGISLVHRSRRIDTPAASSEVVNRVDALQYQHKQGPCLDAIQDNEVVHSRDIADDARWPSWGEQTAQETEIRSMMCFQLFTHEDTIGALNLYSRRPAAFDAHDRDHGLAVAAHAAIAVTAAQQIENLELAMDGRTVIGQAQGILMERFDLVPEHAFAALTRYSSTSNRKLRDVASDIVQTRKLPSS